MVVACCILHNICNARRLPAEEDVVQQTMLEEVSRHTAIIMKERAQLFWARFTNSGLSPSSLMNLAKSIPPIDLDPVHELKSSQLNN